MVCEGGPSVSVPLSNRQALEDDELRIISHTRERPRSVAPNLEARLSHRSLPGRSGVGGGGHRGAGRAQAFRTRTSLCRHSNQSLSATGNSAGKKFGEATETGRAFLATLPVSGRQRPRYLASPAAKPPKVKDYPDDARKPEFPRTAWWGWQDSKSQPSDYEP
jgi:hypothetical protein